MTTKPQIESRATNHEPRATNHEPRATNHESRAKNNELPCPPRQIFLRTTNNELRTKLCKTNPITKRPKMNINKVLTKDYENIRLHSRAENKPNTNPNKPKQTQSNPIKLLNATYFPPSSQEPFQPPPPMPYPLPTAAQGPKAPCLP